MKKIVRGNDFTLRIPVCKIVNGEQVAFPLPACTDIVVNIVNQYRRVALSYTIDTAEDNIINARVEGDAVSVGTYALEVRGKIFGNDWRSKEYEQFVIVDNNASGDTAFNGELIEGEDSVEMNTALVILPPTAELGNLIKDAEETIADTKEALKGMETKIGDIEQRADTAIGAATTAAGNAKTQADRAKSTAEHPNIISEDGYWMVWNVEKGAYEKTDKFSRGTVDFPTFDVNTDEMELNVKITDGNENRYELSKDGELMVNLNM